MSGPIVTFECADLAAITVFQEPRGWGVRWFWEADVHVDDGSTATGFPDRAQAICAGVREILATMDAADPLRRNPAVTGVARQRMDRIRRWAEKLAEQYRPVAKAESLFGGAA